MKSDEKRETSLDFVSLFFLFSDMKVISLLFSLTLTQAHIPSLDRSSTHRLLNIIRRANWWKRIFKFLHFPQRSTNQRRNTSFRSHHLLNFTLLGFFLFISRNKSYKDRTNEQTKERTNEQRRRRTKHTHTHTSFIVDAERNSMPLSRLEPLRMTLLLRLEDFSSPSLIHRTHRNGTECCCCWRKLTKQNHEKKDFVC